MVNRPVAIQHSPPHCERQSRPPRVSDEGVTGESGPLIFFSVGKGCLQMTGSGAKQQMTRKVRDRKDAFAYFVPAALMCRPQAKQVIRADGTSPSGAMIDQITKFFPIGVGGASLNRNS